MKFKVFGALGLVLALAACGSDDTINKGTSVGDGQDMDQPINDSGLLPGSEADLAATAGDHVYFALNQNQLTSEARETLDKQAAWLAHYSQVMIQIAGNCDDRGTEEYNIALGQRRANAVRDYLQAKGVSASRITTISYGKDRPTADGDNEEAWSQNRNAITSVR